MVVNDFDYLTDWFWFVINVSNEINNKEEYINVNLNNIQEIIEIKMMILLILILNL